MRLLFPASVALVAAVVLAGCASPSTESEPDPTAAPVTDVCSAPEGDAARSVSVSGDVGSAPTVEFEPGLTVTETERVVLAQGDEVAPGAPVGVAYSLYNATTGEELETYGYAEGETPTSFRADFGVVAAGFAKTLGCLGPGSRAVGVIPADEGFGDAGAQLGLGADDALVFVIDVLEDQSPAEWTTDLPEIGGTDDAPTLTIADAPAKTDLELTVLREGDGAVVGAADQVTVNYLGVAWETGEVFDSSFEPRGAGDVLGAGGRCRVLGRAHRAEGRIARARHHAAGARIRRLAGARAREVDARLPHRRRLDHRGLSMSPRRVVILGSTGSIGTQALDVVRANPHLFEVVGLAAGSDRAGLDVQGAEFGVDRLALGAVEAEQLVRDTPADVVLNGITGSVGLGPTLAALEVGATLALANKESLIVGGTLVTSLAAPGQIVPVDSEHSAIAQALRSGAASEVRRLVLTASGGPFRGRSRAELASVTPAEALAHPTWDMGVVVTTNSSTLVNKGLEVIEAHLLFDIPFDRIDVVVHPQSIVHSMVEFTDGSTILQASPPDMRLPIALGMSWPDRVPGVGVPLDWQRAQSWEFEPLDEEAFPAVALAKRVGVAGRTFPAVFNAANEEAVTAFHAGRIGYLEIVDTVVRVVERHEPAELSREGVLEAEAWRGARRGGSSDSTDRSP